MAGNIFSNGFNSFKVKNKASFLLISLLCCSGCSYEFETEENIEKSEAINRIEDDFSTEEINLPQEIDLIENRYYANFYYEQDSILHVYIRDLGISNIAPVIQNYDYDYKSNELKNTVLHLNKNESIFDRYLDNEGNTYEMRHFIEDNQRYTGIYFNDEYIEDSRMIVQHPWYLRGFQILDNQIFGLGIKSSLHLENREYSIWNLYKVDGLKIETIHEFKMSRDYNNGDIGNFINIPPIQENTKNRMAFVTRKEGVEHLITFDGYEIKDIELEYYPELINIYGKEMYSEYANNLISLKDCVILESEEMNEESAHSFKYYSINLETGELNLIESGNFRLGRAFQIDENQFYNIDNSKDLQVCEYVNEKIECRTVWSDDETMYGISIIPVDEKTDVVVYYNSISEDRMTYRQNHLVEINWTKGIDKK